MSHIFNALSKFNSEYDIAIKRITEDPVHFRKKRIPLFICLLRTYSVPIESLERYFWN